MDDTNYALQQVVESGSGEYASRIDRPAAGKTGTSSDNQSAWFVGYTPQLATAVALYNVEEDGSPSPIPAFGGSDGDHRRLVPGADLDDVHGRRPRGRRGDRVRTARRRRQGEHADRDADPDHDDGEPDDDGQSHHDDADEDQGTTDQDDHLSSARPPAPGPTGPQLPDGVADGVADHDTDGWWWWRRWGRLTGWLTGMTDPDGRRDG